MKRYARFLPLVFLMFLAGCQNMPQLFWPVDDDKPDYARSTGGGAARAEGRAPLIVPPELRKEIEVPGPDQVATGAAMPEHARKLIAGKAVRLDARLYPRKPAQVFSAVVDAMTALNLPVESVDSPSGTLTTDWIRPNANTPNSYMATITGMFGGGPVYIRYRYVVRVLRAKGGQTMLQVRTLGQQFINRHWVNKPLKKKLANDLFSAVEERLGALPPETQPEPQHPAPPAMPHPASP